eukprot:gb/GFBE01023427.1/.p1 GENE.gb/GFBE01023427.1/~~gb/GFBE01023427.1/.p1  ORF type:complete len:354 (+),score=26.33 gb/GFBE01023427.1/:1-1062(+)
MNSRVPGFSWPLSTTTPRAGKVSGNAGGGADQVNNKPSTPAATPRGSSGPVSSQSMPSTRLVTAEEDRAAGPCGDSAAILENWVVSWAEKMCQALTEAELEASRPNSARGSCSGAPPLSARGSREPLPRRGTDVFRGSVMDQRGSRGGRTQRQRTSGRGGQLGLDSERGPATTGGRRPSGGSPRMPLPPDSLAAVAALNQLERALQPYLQSSMAGGSTVSNGIEAFLSPRYTRAGYASTGSSPIPSRSSADLRLGGLATSPHMRSSAQGQQSQRLQQSKANSGTNPSGAQPSRQPFNLRTSAVPPLSVSSSRGDSGAGSARASGPAASQCSRPTASRPHHPSWPEQEGGPEWR